MKRTTLLALLLVAGIASGAWACHDTPPCCPPPGPGPCEPALEGLLGVTLEKPILGFNSSGQPTLQYQADSGLLVADATLLVFVYDGTQVLLPIGSATLHLEATVLEGGAAIDGVPGDDLVLEGTIDVDGDGLAEYDGDLLRAEVREMGFLASSATVTLFDFTFEVTGGALAGVVGGTAGMALTSENSTFVSFCEDFTGTAKGNLGTTAAGTFCPRSPGYWKTHFCQWPVRYLTIGGVRHGPDELMNLLKTRTPDGHKGADDASVKLAKFMVAAKFDVLSGSAPLDIVETLVLADALLAAYPPGSALEGDVEVEMLALKDLLDAYVNSQDCDTPCDNSDDDEDGDDGDDNDDDRDGCRKPTKGWWGKTKCGDRDNDGTRWDKDRDRDDDNGRCGKKPAPRKWGKDKDDRDDDGDGGWRSKSLKDKAKDLRALMKVFRGVCG